MAIPTYDRFIEPLLRFLASKPEGIAANAAYAHVAEALGLSAEDKQESLPSGTQPIYKNRIGWAHDRLKRAGLSSSPRRGFWKITADGIRFAETNPEPFADSLVDQLATGFLNVKLRERSDGPILGQENVVPAPNEISKSSPEERLEQALEFARSVEGMVLIDGARLAGLMIDFELGVSSKSIKIPKLDSDYFDESLV
jgi:restriction system protein